MMDLVTRAEGYRAIALGLRYPETADLRDGLAALADSAEPVRVFAGLADMVDDALAGEHNRLFATGVAVPPYEASYLRVDKGMRLGQLLSLYEAFGVRPGGTEHELADHAGTEAEFMAGLCVLEEVARLRGEAEHAAVAARARQVFGEEHVGRWFAVFGEKLAAGSWHPFYTHLGELIAAWAETDVADNGWQAPTEPPAPPVRDEDCVVCPMAGKVPQ